MKHLIDILSGLIVLVTPIIWSITYIQFLMDIGFRNASPIANIVGILSILTMITTGRSFIKSVNSVVTRRKKEEKHDFGKTKESSNSEEHER